MGFGRRFRPPKLSIETRLALVEADMKQVQKDAAGAAKYGTTVSHEALYRMWQAEREDNVRMRILFQQREEEIAAFKARVAEGLTALLGQASQISERLMRRTSSHYMTLSRPWPQRDPE